MEILPQDNITASQLECGLKGNRLQALKKLMLMVPMQTFL
jgi:hypothetical protein